MRMLFLGMLLTAASTAAIARPGFIDRFVDAKSGYIVESRDLGGWLRLSGRHPESGSTFRLKVSNGGRVTGHWDGKPVDYRMGKRPERPELAVRSDYPAGAK